jgi:hypothetical protein
VHRSELVANAYQQLRRPSRRSRFPFNRSMHRHDGAECERLLRGYSRPLEKVACGAFSDSGCVSGGERRDFRRLVRETAQVRQAASDPHLLMSSG